MWGTLCAPLQAIRARGGWRQRLGLEGDVPTPAPSRLALGHLQAWGDGDCSSAQLVWHLRHALEDGMQHPMVQRLARCGGDNPTNSRAAIGLVSLVETCGFGDVMTDVHGDVVQKVVLPSSLLALLHTRFSHKFDMLLGTEPGRLERFWGTLRAHSDFAAHVRDNPVLRSLGPEDWKTLVPLTIHEDAGPFTHRQSTNIISWSSLFGAGGEKKCQYMYASYIKRDALTGAQLESVWAPLLHGLETLATQGVGGYRFFVLFGKGDMEVRSNTWGLPHYNGIEVCSECRCNRSSHPYTDLRGGAAWRPTLVVTTEAFRSRLRLPLHPLMASSLFWRRFSPLDLMHVADCNGVACILAGSIIRPLVVGEPRLGRTQDERLAEINRRLVAFYDARPGYSRMAPLRHNNLQLNEWSVLHGKTAKAANTRCLTPFLVELAEAFYDDQAREEHRLVNRAARGMNRFYEIVYGADVFLNTAELSELRRVLLRTGTATQQLRGIARARGEMTWNITPKVHALQHFCEQAGVVNPRCTQNYMEESQVGTTTKVWARAARGRYTRRGQRVVLLKRLVALCVRLEVNL